MYSEGVMFDFLIYQVIPAKTISSCKAGAYKARRTGFEPATTGSTVRYSNQLSYRPCSISNTARRQWQKNVSPVLRMSSKYMLNSDASRNITFSIPHK